MNLFASRRARRWLVIVFLAALVCTLWRALRPPPDPAYNGRRLSQWIAIYQTNDGREPGAVAIRNIGTNAIPSLLVWMRYVPPVLRLPILEQLPKPLLASPPVKAVLDNPEAFNRFRDAVHAFDALGPMAAPAIPELTRMINRPSSPGTRYGALLALGYIGKPAVPMVASLLSNPTNAGDTQVMQCVRELGTNANPLVSLLTRNLTHTPEITAHINARMLGELKCDPHIAVPALAKCLQDSRRDIRLQAIWALQEFRTNARPALGALSIALQDTDPLVRIRANDAVQIIAPELLQVTPPKQSQSIQPHP